MAWPEIQGITRDIEQRRTPVPNAIWKTTTTATKSALLRKSLAESESGLDPARTILVSTVQVSDVPLCDM